jgi:hypothetical protein
VRVVKETDRYIVKTQAPLARCSVAGFFLPD